MDYFSPLAVTEKALLRGSEEAVTIHIFFYEEIG